MAEFFLSAESEREIQRNMLNRQRQFERKRQQVSTNPQIAQRLLDAEQLNPSAPKELKQAYAVSQMSDEQFIDLSQRDVAENPNDAGLIGQIGDAVKSVGMGFWDQALKPAIRGAFAVVDTAAHEVVQRPLTAGIATATGEADSFDEAYQDYGNSAGVIAGRNLLDGDPQTDVDLGHGFLLGGQNAEEADRQRQLSIQGEKASFGRALTSTAIGEGGIGHMVTGRYATPGDTAYDVMAGITQFLGDVALDPTAWATFGATKALTASKGLDGVRTFGRARRGISPTRANEAAHALEEYGMVAGGQRSALIFEQSRRVLGNPALLEDMANSSTYEIFRRMRPDRLGVGKTSDELADLVTRLGDETTPEGAGEILIDAAARGQVRERGFYKGVGTFKLNAKESLRDMRLDKNLPEARYGGVNPSQAVSASNPMQSAIDIDGLLRLAKVGEADRARIVTRALKTTNNTDLMDVVDDTVRTIGRKMEDVGVDSEDVEKLIKEHRHSMSKATSYLVDRAGKPSPPPWSPNKQMTIQGVDAAIEAPEASMIAHLNKQAIPLPDPKDIRRATVKLSGLRKVYQSNGWEMGSSAARWTNRYLFKFPTLFTRLAYPLRNNLDNQMRSAAGGYDSIFTNPIRWMSLGVVNPKKFDDLVVDPARTLAAGRSFRLSDGTYGRIDDLDDETGDLIATLRDRDGTERVVNSTLEEFRPDVASVSRNFNEVARDTKALTEDAAGMWADEGARRSGAYRVFQQGVDDDFAVAWRHELGIMHNDPIGRAVADIAHHSSRDELVDHIINTGLVDEASKLSEQAKRFFKRNGVDPDRSQVNEYVDYIEDHIDRLTNGNQQLRHMLATGDLNGVPFNDLTQNPKINQLLRDRYLKDAPQHVSGPDIIRDGPRSKALWKRSMDEVVDFMASRPENRFTRFPLLAQVFADDLSRSMATLADDTLRADLVQRAADAGFDDKLFPQIAQAAHNAAGQRGVVNSIDDTIDAAKLHSTDAMLDIAFDATTRSSFQEMADVLVPFWDAFAEIGTSWGRLLRDNPAAFSRGTSALDSLRESGVTYVNENGEEVFAYPGGGMLAKFLGVEEQGSPRFEGRLEGLNLMVQGFGPGVGPMVQWGASALLPKHPDVQWIRDVVTPYGSEVNQPGDILDPSNLIKDLTPAWFQKTLNVARDGDYDEVAYNSAIGDALKVLATTGGYDPAKPEDQRRLQEDAQKAGKWTMFVRSMLQMGAPTGPGVAWDVKTDPDGAVHRLQTMANAYFELLEGSDASTANAAFIDLYGVEPFWIAQSKTRELREGPRTRKGWNWIGRHDEAAEAHGDVIGYFVPPEDPSAPPDYGMYRTRIENGDIDPLTPEQQLQLANKTKARAIYNVVRQRTEALPSAQRQRSLQDTRTTLEEHFPGWQADVLGVASRTDREETIRKLEIAALDGALADSPVTEPLRAYLTLRSQVFAEIERRGGPTTLEAQANADLRTWLADRGQQISDQVGAFQGVWRNLLSSEVD